MMAEGIIRVMIVDDHDMVRMGLKTYLSLEPSFEVIAEAGDGQQAITYLRHVSIKGQPEF